VHTYKYDWNLNDERRYLVNEREIQLENLRLGDEVRMDFSNVGFVTPFCLLGILLNCRRIKDITKHKVLLTSLSDAVYLHFRRMKVFDVADDIITIVGSYSSLIPWAEVKESTNLIEVTRIAGDKDTGSQDIIRVGKLLRDRASNILAVWLGKEIAEAGEFVTVLSEIAQNIFEHSDDYGYVALNKYVYSDKVRLNLSIIDGGAGIGNTVRAKLKRRGKKLRQFSEYLAYPFEIGLSRSGGGGLRIVYQKVKDWGGSIFVRSENSIAVTQSMSLRFELRDNVHRFQGTHIGIWLEGPLR